MSKISVDIEYIKSGLQKIGYEISDCTERENNGKNWQFKFNNSGAIVTIYDSNKVKNSVVNGKADQGEKTCLKEIVDGLKSKELVIDPLNQEIVNLIRSKKEDSYYDFKMEFHKEKEDLVHDILCLSNNIENRDAYLIIGVSDDSSVIGIEEDLKSNNIYDLLKTISFAGDHMPDIEVKNMYYMSKKISVIVCKSSKYVPFYLTQRYKGVNDNQIYTRVGDTNTAKNKHANYSDIEKLWRIHFKRENE